jgi:hypothetical protein
MTDLFIAVLMVALCQHVLGLGNWVWWVAGATSLVDIICHFIPDLE